MRATLRKISGSILVLFLLAFTSGVLGLDCTDDTPCIAQYGDLSICKNMTCGCVDFHGLVNGDGGLKCRRSVGLGGKCTKPKECQNALGSGISTCNMTTNRCECTPSVDGGETGYWNGKCYKLRQLGQPCAEDGECILGSNELSRCVNVTGEFTCDCYTNVNVTLIANQDGFCQLEVCPEQKTSMSVFAVTFAGSVALFVVIVLIYQFTKYGYDRKN